MITIYNVAICTAASIGRYQVGTTYEAIFYYTVLFRMILNSLCILHVA